MTRNLRSAIRMLVLLAPALLLGPGAAAPNEPPTAGAAAAPLAALTAEEQAALEQAVNGWLVDPVGKAYVRVPRTFRSAWGSAGEAVVEGWLAPAEPSGERRIYFLDGDWLPAPPAPEPFDFVAKCRAAIAAAEAEARAEAEAVAAAEARARRQAAGEPAADEPPGMPDIAKIMRRLGHVRAPGSAGAHLAVQAAWLWRLGEKDLALRALRLAGSPPRLPSPDAPPEKDGWIRDLAWAAYAGAVHAFMVAADAEALQHAERLLKLYPAYAQVFGDGAALRADLRRRAAAGTLGRQGGDQAPSDFATWPVARRAAWLIEALDQVNARQWGQPGGVPLGSDWRVQALAELGDAAVPPLLECFEQDRRLTRSVHFWRDFHPSRTVLGVHEAALTALQGILRVRVFESASTGDNLTARGEGKAADVARQLRSYWKRYGRLPFAERMMEVLSDPANTGDMALEAAGNLAQLDRPDRGFGTMFGGSWTVVSDGQPAEPSSAVARFSAPTVAEATLAALDRHLAASAAQVAKETAAGPAPGTPPRDPTKLELWNQPEWLTEHRGAQVERGYAQVLAELGDRRAAPLIAARAAGAPTLARRLAWAKTAAALDAPAPLVALAQELAANRLAPPADDGVLRDVVCALAGAGLPDTETALRALAEPANAWHARVLKRLVGGARGFDDRPLLGHPYCLAVLRRGLEDETATGMRYEIRGGARLRRVEGNGWSEGELPSFLADPARRRRQAAIRRCDEAAASLAELLVGAIPYHALFRDAEPRRALLKEVYDRYAGRWRLPDGSERAALGFEWRSEGSPFVPGIEPLDRPATAADVAAGRALFHQDGKGRVAGLELPASAWRKTDLAAPGVERDKVARVLIVQAELTPAGEVRLGYVAREGFGVAGAEELESVRSLAER